MAIRVKIEGLDELLKAIDPKIVRVPARSFLRQSGNVVQDKAREYAPNDRGGLRRSIKTRVDLAAMPRYVEIGSNLEYAAATEFGRPPGKMPPVGPLEVWARRKGLGEGAAWPIALHIMNHGTEPQPYLEPAVRESVPHVQRLVTAMAAEIERRAQAAGGGR